MIGTEINGQYRILELLGEGGMGEVYKALDIELDRLVALKFLKAEFGDDRVLIQRFRDELRTLAGFNHPNITTLYTTFTWAARPVMVMELVEGETLLSMVNRRGPIPSHVCAPLIKQALAGVGEAHRKMIIHRDLKPANLMLNRDGVVKVMDFGIAKMQNAPGLTRSNAAIGTCLYMAPEQIRGTVDARTDIYAMGVTFYELLAGRVPFIGNSEYDIQTAHIQQIPEPPSVFYPYIPKPIVEAVMRALAKDPAQRFQTADEFSSALGNGRPQTLIEQEQHVHADTAPESTLGFTPGRRTGPDEPPIAHFPTPPPIPATAPSTPAPVAQTPAPTAAPTPTPASWTPANTPAPAPWTPIPTSATVSVAEPVPSRLDVILQNWFGRTGRPRLTGAAVAAAALLLLGGGGFLIHALMQPAPGPGPYQENALIQTGGGGGGGGGGGQTGGGGGSIGGGGGGQTGGGGGSSIGGGGGSSIGGGGGDSIGGGSGGGGGQIGGGGAGPIGGGGEGSGSGGEKTDSHSQVRPQSQVSELAGRWAGSYERCEDNSRTQATLDLSESSSGSVSGTLLLSSPGGSIERCSLSGTFMAQQKSFSFYVPSCAGSSTPAYLRAPHKSLLRLAGGELTGDVEPQDSCFTARFKKM